MHDRRVSPRTNEYSCGRIERAGDNQLSTWAPLSRLIDATSGRPPRGGQADAAPSKAEVTIW